MSSEKAKKEEKPPIGLKPRFVWLKMRKMDIEDAMRRYVKANKEVPLTEDGLCLDYSASDGGYSSWEITNNGVNLFD